MRVTKLYNDTNHEGVKESIQETKNNEEQIKCIQEYSISKPTDEWRNKVIDLMEISRMNNTDKCSKCGAVKISPMLICGFHGVQGVNELALMCQQCDTNISACARVLDIEF